MESAEEQIRSIYTMQNLFERLKQKFSSAIATAFKERDLLGEEWQVAEVSSATNPQFGHYQCNSALKLAKILKENPREVAQAILSLVDLSDGMVQKTEIAGPGFINVWLSPHFLSREIEKLLKDERLGISPLEHSQKIIVEFSSPNIAKELHVGHLRSTIIGDCLARVFEFLGHTVLRLNHIGDWGTQFGMLIAHMRKTAPEIFQEGESAIEKTDLALLMKWYQESKKRFDSDPLFKKQAQLEVVKLQRGDPESLTAWRIICAISKEAFHAIYQLLEVKLVERGESFYNPFLEDLIADLEKKKLITLSDGAKCIFMEGFKTMEGTPLPMIVQKSDGGYNYDTTDLAAFRHRIEVEKAERIVIVTDLGQSLHFQMLAKAAELAGYLDPRKVQFDHVTFGVVLGQDGKKFKTREGGVEKLIDLLYEAIDRAKEILKERLADFSEKELDQLARTVGIGAVKYADLSGHRLKDYVFSYDRMLRFEGNTAAFMLYAYVRIQGIKRKVGRDPASLLQSGKIVLEHPSEIALALHLRRFPEMIELLTRDLLPNRLSDYLFELAEKFHAFFRDCRVEGSPEEESRLLLSEATARMLKKGLNLLGLDTVERM